MDSETLDSLDKEVLIRLILSRAEAIERSTKEVEALRADNAGLRTELDLPPKTPDNSSTLASPGPKAAGDESKSSEEKRRKPHAVEKGETRGFFLKIAVDADAHPILVAAILGAGGDEVLHGILDIMYATVPYTTLRPAAHIHPKDLEIVPTALSELAPAP